jgi:hypothetical protein
MPTAVRALTTCLFALAASSATAQPTLPNEFETPGVALQPLFSYFGGVNGFGVEPSAELVHSGNSLRIWGNFRADIFSAAGFAVGTLGITGAQLARPAGANTVSVCIDAPQTTGTLGVYLTFREDDDGDNAIDVNGNDDSWEVGPIFLVPGPQVVNVALSALEDSNPGIGNDINNLMSAARIGYFLTFETRNAWPGGRIVTPVSLHVDHLGFYVGNQSLPTATCDVDLDGSGAADVPDVFAFLSLWFAGSAAADFDGANGVGVPDIFGFLAAWFAGC